MSGAGSPAQASRLPGCQPSPFIPPCCSNFRRSSTKKSEGWGRSRESMMLLVQCWWGWTWKTVSSLGCSSSRGMWRNQTSPVDGCEDDQGWGWMGCKENLQKLGPFLIYPAWEGDSKEYFLPLVLCAVTSQEWTELHNPPTMLSITPDVQEFRAMSTKTCVALPPAPFRCTQVLEFVTPLRSNFQVPDHGWMHSHPHHPKPQLHYSSKVTNKRGGYQLNSPSVGESPKKINNSESRRWSSIY